MKLLSMCYTSLILGSMVFICAMDGFEFTKSQLDDALIELKEEEALLQGKLYFFGEGAIPPDYQKCFEWLEKAARADQVHIRDEALYFLARLFYEGKAREEDIPLILWRFERIHSFVKNPIMRAWLEYVIGLLYIHEKDYDKAISYFEVSGNQSEHKEIQIRSWLQLGDLYFGKKNDDNKAEIFYEKAANQEINVIVNSEAWFHLGDLYRYAPGVKQGYEKALKCYEKVAGHSFNPRKQALAWCELGHFYRFGLGVNKDYRKSSEYYELAARQTANIGAKTNAEAMLLELMKVDNILSQRPTINLDDSDSDSESLPSKAFTLRRKRSAGSHNAFQMQEKKD